LKIKLIFLNFQLIFQKLTLYIENIR
jgi:hypothetical protein